MAKISIQLSIVLFGAAMALLILLLKYFEYRYFIGSLDTEIYIAVVSVIFTGLGVWIGYKIIGGKKPITIIKEVEKELAFEIDQERLDELNLNNREYEILKLISTGMTNKEISEELFIAIPTVKTHTSNLYAKMVVKNRTQAVHKAQSLKLI